MNKVLQFGAVCLACALGAQGAYRLSSDVRSLPRQEALRARPVELEGQIVCDFRANAGGAGFVLLDSAGGLYVRETNATPWQVGDVVRVTGVTHEGYYASVADARAVEIFRREPLPHGIPAEPESIVAGAYDYRYVTLSGVAVAAFPDKLDPRWYWIYVQTPTAMVSVSFCCAGHVSPAYLAALVDAEVSLDGIAMPIYNARAEFLGSRVNLASRDALRVLRRAPADPLAVPFIRGEELYNLSSAPAPLHRRRLAGVVTAVRGSEFFLQRGAHALRIAVEEGGPLPDVGDKVEAAGFIDAETFFVGLGHAKWRRLAAGCVLPPARDITPGQVLSKPAGVKLSHPDFHGETVRIKGVLRSQTDSGTLHVDCGGCLVSADTASLKTNLPPLRLGSVLAVSGVCVMEFTETRPFKDFPQVKRFSLIVRSPADIAILRQASWWTPVRLLAVIGGLALLLFAILVWNLVLRHLVEKRSRELFRGNIARAEAELRVDERTRLAAELHDSFAQSLMGIALQVEATELAQTKAPGEVPRDLHTVHQMLLACRDELRRCVWNLRAQALEAHNLAEAIEKVVAPCRAQAAITVHAEGPRFALSDSTLHSLLRITQELVLNAVNHGRAKKIQIHIACTDAVLSLTVEDDGVGFDPARAPGVPEGHFGLQGVRERVKRLEGEFTVKSAPGKGARFTVTCGKGAAARHEHE